MSYPAPILSLDFVNGGWHPALAFSRASTGTLFDKSGILRAARAGVPRRDHDPLTGICKGLFPEDQRTNHLLNSGTPATQTVSLAAGTYTLWVVGSGSCALSGGPAGTATAGAPVTFTLGGTTSVTFTVSGSLTRFQCEPGSFPTSYISTAGTAVTRSADVCTVALSSLLGPHGEQLWNGTEGTLLVRGSVPYIPASGSVSFATLDDGTGNNNVRLRLLSTGVDGAVIVGGTWVFDPVDHSYIAGEQVALAVAFQANDFAFSRNGASPATGSSGAVPTVTKLSIGSTAGLGNWLNGHIRQVTLFNRRLSNATLQALTA